MKSLFRIIAMTLFILCLATPSSADDRDADLRSRYRQYIDKAEEFRKKAVFDSARICYDSAELLIRQLNEPLEEVILACKMGNVYWQLGYSEMALSTLQQARKDAYELKSDSLIALSENTLGIALSRTGLVDSALTMYYSALSHYEKLQDSLGMATVWSNISILHKNLGAKDKAIDAALEAFWIMRNIDDPKQQISALISLGNAYRELEMYDTAMSCYQEAYDFAVEKGFDDYAFKAVTNQSVLYYDLEDYEKCRDGFLRSIAYYESVGDDRELIILYSNISIPYRILEDYKGSVEISKKSIALAERMGDVGMKQSALNNLGIAYKWLGRYEEAEACYRESLGIAMNMGSNKEMLRVYENLANLYEITGRYQESIDYFRLYDSVSKLLNSEMVAEAIAETQTKYEVRFLKEQKQIALLDQARLRAERNTTVIVGVLIVATLVWLAFFLRYRLRKNRVIATQRIRQLEDEKKILAAQSVILGQEEERKRIARELHDGIGVLLSTAKIQFSSIESEEKDPEAIEIFHKAHRMLDKAGKEVRRISHDMMPGVLSKFGLKEAVEDLFEEIRELSKLEINLSIKCPDERLPEDHEIMIYRVVQEMVNNTIKHANASRIDFSMTRKESVLEINYADNGTGFDESTLPHDKGLGLDGIRSRIDFLGGRIEIQSATGKGTALIIHIPLDI